MRKFVFLSVALGCAFISSVSAAGLEPELQVELVSPAANGVAQLLQSVVFRSKISSAERPFLVVRSAEPNSLWWVQERLEKAAGGRLKGVAWIGNDKTPTDSEFLVKLIVPRDASAHADLKRGSTLKDLTEFRTSKTFTLITDMRGRSEQASTASR